MVSLPANFVFNIENNLNKEYNRQSTEYNYHAENISPEIDFTPAKDTTLDKTMGNE